MRNIAKTAMIRAAAPPMETPMMAPVFVAKEFLAGEVGTREVGVVATVVEDDGNEEKV